MIISIMNLIILSEIFAQWLFKQESKEDLKLTMLSLIDIVSTMSN